MGAAANGSAQGFDVACSFSPATRTVEITGTGDGFLPVISRSGTRLLVADEFGFGYRCHGGKPTVHNVDTILIRSHAPVAMLSVDLRGGAIGPGATDEGDGSSEIEIDARLGVEESLIEVYGTSGRDRMTMGRVVGSDAALNLNASEPHDDADLIFHGNDEQFQIDLGGGRDRFSAATTDGFEQPYRTLAFVDGGPGHDRLVGGPGRQGFVGGNGRDTLLGGRGPDALYGDEYGHPHEHPLKVPDRFICGPGLDTARADRSDSVRGCEHVDRRHQAPLPSPYGG